MTQNPYAPPSAQVADPIEPPAPKPRRVIVAMVLFCAAAAMGVTMAIVQHREHIVGQIGFPIGVTAGLCLAIAARRNWARWVYSVLIGLTWLAMIPDPDGWLRPPYTSAHIVALAIDAMELVALILLFTGPSSRWFKQPRSPG